MKANELQIGDWVKIVEPCKYAGAIGCVKTLIDHKDDENAYFKVFLRNNTIHIGIEDICSDDVKPIPLTLDILEKNGFEKVIDEDGTECYRYYNSAADGYIKISLYNGGDGDWSIEIINYEKFDNNEIIYNNNFTFLKVHQLQHALRLCEIEKTIEL